MTTTSAIGIVGAAICAVLLLLIQVRAKVARHAREQLQREWRQKIERLADDRSTDPEGLSLDDVMDSFDQPYWEEICSELEKMPTGQRSLRKAIEIAGEE